MGDTRSVVVVGAGLGGLSVCEALRQQGFDGPVTLLGAEPVPPYDRPPLSKDIVKGTRANPPVLRTPGELEALRLDLRLDSAAVGVDLAAREVILAAGGRLRYDVLVIATGARPRRWKRAADMQNVWTLRTDSDAAQIAAFVQGTGRLGVLGGGFIGCEVAASAREMGCPVTLFEVLPAPLARVLGTAAGEEIAQRHRAAGVDLRCGVAVEEIVADGDGRFAGVRLSDGSVLALDALVVGLGVVPNVEWLDSSGLAIDDGIVCDAGGRTSHADVYAVGDVARWHDIRSGSHRRREHWTTTTEQAAVVAGRIAGQEERTLEEVPYFWSDQYGTKIQCVGDADPAAEITRLVTGKNGDRPLYLYGREGRLVAAVGFGLPAVVTRLRRLIAEGASVDDAIAQVEALHPAVTGGLKVSSAMRVGFVGLGNQGAPMAQRIVGAGFECALWARRPEAVAPFLDGPARVVESLPALGHELDLLCCCVFDAAGAWEVLFGPQGAAVSMPPGAVIAVHSTVAPREVQELAENARRLGLDLIDAPVSGGAARAAEGELITMVGADTASWERYLPVFETFSSLVVNVGAVGAGQQAKLLNNAMLTAHLAIADDAFAIGDRLGLNRSALASVLLRGSGRSFGAEMLIAAEDMTGIARSPARSALGKDIGLLLAVLNDAPEAMARDDAVLVPAARHTIDRIEALAERS